MNKTVLAKTRSTIIITALIAALIISALFSTLFNRRVYAASDTAGFSRVSITPENANFSSYSGSVPATPDSWTENIPHMTKGNAVTGVIDVTTFASSNDNIDNAKLDEYPEFSGSNPIIPEIPSKEMNSADKDILMINTRKAGIASNTGKVVTFESTSMTFEANKYYSVSAWVKTGGFANNEGAAIRLTGLDNKDIAFTRINTLKGDNFKTAPSYGWEQYTFYIKTSPLAGADSVKIVLSVGDYYDNGKTGDEQIIKPYPANGYAFFDTVEAFQISAAMYNSGYQDELFNRDQTAVLGANQNTQYIDLSLESAFISNMSVNENRAFSFKDESGWVLNSNSGADFSILSAKYAYSDNNPYGFDSAPVSSTGSENNRYPELDNIGVISSYNATYGKVKDFNSTIFGIESKNPLTIEPYKYYRLSLFVKTENMVSGAGATIKLLTKKEETKTTGNKGTEIVDDDVFTISSATGDASLIDRDGWKEHSFYIQGSSLAAKKVYLRLQLGDTDSPAGGIVMFHNIRFDVLTNKQFTENSANGTIATFDGEFANNNKGVANSGFMLFDEYEKIEFPLAPAAWTKITPSTANLKSYSVSDTALNHDDVVMGVMPTNSSFRGNNDDLYSSSAPATNDISYVSNEHPHVMTISSFEPTVIGYQSSDITITASTATRVSVKLFAEIPLDSYGVNNYGATLMLVSDGQVISNIEKIGTTMTGKEKTFKTFSFILQPGDADRTVSLQIWLGAPDRKDNFSKRSAGTVFVAQVSSEALGETETFEDLKSAYFTERSLAGGVKTINNPVYEFGTQSLDYYDFYDDSFVKTPYNWTLSLGSGISSESVAFGIFDSSSINPNSTEVHKGFDNPDKETNIGVLLLYNKSAAYSTMTLENAVTLAASSYYKISVSALVETTNASDTAIGATISLGNKKLQFKNIHHTIEKNDSIEKLTFQTFTFYIISGAEETSLNLSASLGGSEIYERVAGRIYINNISIETIESGDHSTALKNYNKLTEDKQGLQKFINLSEIETEDAVTPDEGTSEINWLLIPSIIFSLALLLALTLVIVTKLRDKRHKRPVTEKVSLYDRTVSGKPNAKSKTTTMTAGGLYDDKQYEEFDDILPPAPHKLTSKPKAATAAVPYEPNEFDDDAEIVTETAEETTEKVETETAEQAKEANPEKAQKKQKAHAPVTNEFDD